MKENDGLERIDDALKAVNQTIADFGDDDPERSLDIEWGNVEIRVKHLPILQKALEGYAALKSPPEIEGEYTLEGNSAAFVYVCQDGKKIATVYGSGEEKLERGYTIINALNAALPHCPDGFVCVPREPTEEILTAALFQGKWPTRESFDNFYALLIAAAEGN